MADIDLVCPGGFSIETHFEGPTYTRLLALLLSSYLRAWDAPDDHSHFSLNVDNTYYIMRMKMSLADLPDHDEFRKLFAQFKITSWKTTITPTMKDNQSYAAAIDSAGTWNQINPDVPNMEMFIIPATYNVHTSTRNWDTLPRLDIDDILNQTQTKARRLIPSRGFSFNTTRPQIVKTGFMPTKGNTPALQTETHLGRAPWLDNGAGPHQDPADPHPDQRLVEHYGYTVLCRRVDGLNLPVEGESKLVSRCPIGDQPAAYSMFGLSVEVCSAVCYVLIV